MEAPMDVDTNNNTHNSAKGATETDPFQKVLDQLPDVDQGYLIEQGITSFRALLDHKAEWQPKLADNSTEALRKLCPEVKRCLHVLCAYLETLEGEGPEYHGFGWAGFENFCGYHDRSGDLGADDLLALEPRKRPADDGKASEGSSLTAEERKQMELAIENDPLTMKIRGFGTAALVWESDNHDPAEEATEATEVEFHGVTYRAKKCYYYDQPQSGATVTVGIRGFTKDESKAICALVIPLGETVLGRGLVEAPPPGVPATYDEDPAGLPAFCQVRHPVGRYPILPLSALKECSRPAQLPEVLYEGQQPGQKPHNFGFVREHDGSNRGAEREEIRFVDFFAGSGGFHQGLTQVPGFRGLAAVEYWEVACKTFAKNNPETEVFLQKVEDFLEEFGPGPADFRKRFDRTDFIPFSSPCQAFSGSNRNVDHTGEKDLYRKNLSLQFVNAMVTSGALVGVFENVEGMWRRPNVYWLKKIVADLLRKDYQVRVRLHLSHEFGDPQSRPRLLIYAAKKFVEMPTVLETHGPGKHPPVTAGTALAALDRHLEKVRDDPDAPPVPNLEGSKVEWSPRMEQDTLDWDKPASTIRCGGRVWHPKHQRCLTVREVATLQSYPPDYEFLGSLTDQYKQVGNAVPGRMARAVAMAVAESLRFVYHEEELLLAREEDEAPSLAVEESDSADVTNTVSVENEAAVEQEDNGDVEMTPSETPNSVLTMNESDSANGASNDDASDDDASDDASDDDASNDIVTL